MARKFNTKDTKYTKYAKEVESAFLRVLRVLRVKKNIRMRAAPALNAYLAALVCLSTQVRADTIKVGLLAPLSGPKIESGQMMKNGITLALQEFNEDPKRKYKLELLSEDSAQAQNGAVDGFNKLVAQGVHYIVGPYSFAEIQTVSALSTQTKTILLNATARADELSQGGPYMFRVIHSVSDEALFFSRFVGVSMTGQALHFIAINSPLSDSYVKTFEGALVKQAKVVGSVEKFSPTGTDMRPQILRVRRQDPSDIFLIGTGSQVGTILRQASDWKVKAQFYSIEVEGPDLIARAGQLANGLYFVSSYDNASQEPAVQNFSTKYRENFKIEPNLVSAASHDALLVLGECLDVEGDKVEQVKKCLHNIKDFQGAAGAFSLDENGQAHRSFVVKVVRDGKLVTVS